MLYTSTKYYLCKLIKDGHQWQYTDINGFTKKPKFFFSQLQLILLVIAAFTSYTLKKGFNNEFVSYSISALSIFVGLFLTLMVSVFDKFSALKLPELKKQILADKGSLSDREKTILIQKKNFFIQFTALTAYSIVISIFCILLLSVSLLCSQFSQDYSEYKFVGWDSITYQHFVSFLKLGISYIHRITTIYFLLDFLLIVLYAVSGIYNYFSIEYKQIRLSEDET